MNFKNTIYFSKIQSFDHYPQKRWKMACASGTSSKLCFISPVLAKK